MTARQSLNGGLRRPLLFLILSILVLVIALPIILINSLKVSAFSGEGDGSSGSPFMVTNCSELQSIDTDASNGETYNKVYQLANNIDCTATSTWNSGDGFKPIGYFEGTLDGNGYTINGLTINRPSEPYIGLFSILGYESLVARVRLTNVNITGGDYVGGMAGEASGHFLDVRVQGSVTGNSAVYYYGVGGIAGRKGNPNGSSSRLVFTGTVTNTGISTGGLFGYAGNVADLTDSYVDATINGAENTGGIIGRTGACCNRIRRVYMTGTVNGTSRVGGLIGKIQDANDNDNAFEDSFAAASVTGSFNIGAVIGEMFNINAPTFTNIAYDQTLAGGENCVGIANSGTVNCTARNTDGLNASFFYNKINQPLASWNFTSVWSEEPGDYPSLRPVTQLTAPGVVSNISAAFPYQPNRAQISFDPPADSGSFPIQNYELQVKVAGADWNDAVANDQNSESPLNANDLQLDQDYVARVRASNLYGYGEWTEYNFSTNPAATLTVSTCQELNDVDEVGSVFDNITLTSDIDCTGQDFDRGLFSGEEGYHGTFDGQFYTISNLTIDQPEDYYIGLFSYTDEATIKDVTLSGGSMTGASDVGALIGSAYNTNVSNVQSDLDVVASDTDGYYTGGLIGRYELQDEKSATIENVSSSGDVAGAQSQIGGLIGFVRVDGFSELPVELTISKASHTGAVSAEGIEVGGLIGRAEVNNDDDGYAPARIIIEDSYSQGSVQSLGDVRAGGIIGVADAYNDEYDSTAEIRLDRVYSTANVSAAEVVGGLIGTLYISYPLEKITITDSFAAGSVTGDYAHAIVGGTTFADLDGEFTMENTYFDAAQTGKELRFYADTDQADFAVNDAGEDPNYFIDNTINPPLNMWDFDTVWLANSSDYPTLRSNFVVTSDELPASSAEDNSTILVQQTGCSGFGEWAAKKESELEKSDVAYNYPKGFIGFELIGCSNGTATINAIFTGEFDLSKVTIRKYNAVTKTYTTLTSENSGLVLTKTILEGKAAIQANYNLVDGGALDQDGVVNGTIVDPIGLGILTIAAPNTGLERIR